MKFFWASLLLCLTASLHAAPLERDLGQGLVYKRVAILPADLPGEKNSPASLVLDLRYATGNEAAAIALGAWLDFHKSARAFLVILANGETSAPLRQVINAHHQDAGTLALGPLNPGFDADLTLTTKPADERAAYDALTKDSDLQTLIQPKLDKYRYDEAALAAHRNAQPEEENDAQPDTELADKSVTAAPPSAPPFDAVLQRAVQIHRSLLALRKITPPKA